MPRLAVEYNNIGFIDRLNFNEQSWTVDSVKHMSTTHLYYIDKVNKIKYQNSNIRCYNCFSI